MLRLGSATWPSGDVDLAPEAIREEVDEIITDIYEPINNGVYRAGFATKQGSFTTRPSTNCSTPSTTGIRSSKTNGSSLATS